MSFLTNEDMLYIDFGDNTFDVESANRKAETVYDGKHFEQMVTDKAMEEGFPRNQEVHLDEDIPPTPLTVVKHP